jgi:hypothetical protein
MSSLTTVDAKGNVYLIPQDVLAKHCKKLGNIRDRNIKVKPGVLQSDWPNCYIWINDDNTPWVNCPELPGGDKALWAEVRRVRAQKVKAQRAKAKK